MYGMLGSLYLHGALAAGMHQTQSATEGGCSKAVAAAQREMKILTERLEKLILMNMAMWSLIQEKTGLSEEDLMQRVQEIDLRDGVADGKITRTIKQCGHCGRTISKRHTKCLYCGSEVLTETPFESI